MTVRGLLKRLAASTCNNTISIIVIVGHKNIPQAKKSLYTKVIVPYENSS